MLSIFFEKMSKLLNELIKQRKANALSYEDYLKEIAELAKQTNEGQSDDMPEVINSPGKRALYNNLDKDEIEYFTIASTGSRVDFGTNSPNANRSNAGAANATRGLSLGGVAPKSNEIDYITMASDGSAVVSFGVPIPSLIFPLACPITS